MWNPTILSHESCEIFGQACKLGFQKYLAMGFANTLCKLRFWGFIHGVVNETDCCLSSETIPECQPW